MTSSQSQPTASSQPVRLPTTMEQSSKSEIRVRYSETDQMGVVYHTNYLVWCEIGRTDFIRMGGLTYAELERRGILLAVADASIRYHGAARYDDLVRVETTLAAVRSRAVTFDYLITNASTGERLASARTALVSLDRQGRPVTLPQDFRRRLLQSVREAAID
jgi:acyl-CoA thioester hydrolase